MANMGIISRLILRNSSQASLPRWLSTEAARPRSRNTLFYKVVGVGSNSSTVDVMNEWVAAGRIVKKADIINLSSYFRSRKNYRAALQLYEWMDSSNLPITDADQAIRIDLLGRAEGTDSAETYLDSLPEKTNKTYGALLSCYCRGKVWDKALETFEKIKKLNAASTLDYNNMLSLYYKLEKHEKVISLVQEMEEKNTPLDAYTYNRLINSHAYLKNLDAVEEVVEKMESSDVKPDRFTYGNLATIFFNSGMHEQAAAFLKSMEKMNLRRRRADEAAHIHLLGKIEGSASAEKYFNSLQQKSMKTYRAILSCYCKDLVLDKALEIFEKINESNNTVTMDYKYMLSLYYDLEQHEKVVSLVQEMEERKIAPDTYTYNFLINSLVALKNLDAIDGVLEKMEIANIKRNSSTYVILATAYLNSGLHEKASTFLQLMEQMKLKKGDTVKVCHIRLKLYSMMKDPDGVNRAWEDLKSDEQKPANSSYLYMLLALSRLGDHGNVEKIFKEWEEGCTRYDYRLSNVLLEYYLSRSMVEKATLLYNKLVDRSSDRGDEPNSRTLELFAVLCLKKGEIDLAMEYLEKGRGKVNSQKSCYPRNETIEEFIKYFEDKSDRERGGKFIESMKKQNRQQSDSLRSYIEATEGGKP